MERNTTGEHVVPVIAEELEIGKRQVETGAGVRVRKTVTEREQVVDEPLLFEHAEVTRVPVNRVVEAAPPIRQEGDTMIVSIVEEQIIVEKRLLLKEEIHIRRTHQTVRRPQVVTLREEHAHVERFGLQPEPVVEQAAAPPASGSILERVFPPTSKK